jgi:predicted nucleotidyltransferase
MIDLTPDQLAAVRAILAAHLPEATVFAFGSRARGTARPHSDLDLAVAADAPLPLDRLEALRDAFAASNLPMQVDVVDYRAVSAAFRRIIDATKTPLGK